MIMTIQNHTRKNWAVKEVFLAFWGIFWGTQGVQIYDSRPLEMDYIDLWGILNFEKIKASSTWLEPSKTILEKMLLFREYFCCFCALWGIQGSPHYRLLAPPGARTMTAVMTVCSIFQSPSRDMFWQKLNLFWSAFFKNRLFLFIMGGGYVMISKSAYNSVFFS